MKKTEISFSENQLTIIEKASVSIFRYTDIIGVFCEHPYLKIETINKNRKLFFHSLKEIEKLLPFPFVMCNRSAIINLLHLIQIKTENSNCYIHLNNGQKIPVSRRKKNELMEKIKQL